jgi:hypothetical protein
LDGLVEESENENEASLGEEKPPGSESSCRLIYRTGCWFGYNG